MADYNAMTNAELAGVLTGEDVEAILKYRDRDSVYDEAANRLLSRLKINSKEDFKETCGCLIEIFEEFLESRGIDVPNDEKDEDPDASTIYGTDYSELESAIAEFFQQCGYVEDDVYV